MSIRDFIDLNKIAFGAEKFTIQCKYMGQSFQQFGRDQLKNIFLYTGQRSYVVYKQNGSGNKLFYMPFDNYVNLYDLWAAAGYNGQITVHYVAPQLSFLKDLKIDPVTGALKLDDGVNNCYFPTNFMLRYFIVTYDFSKILQVTFP